MKKIFILLILLTCCPIMTKAWIVPSISDHTDKVLIGEEYVVYYESRSNRIASEIFDSNTAGFKYNNETLEFVSVDYYCNDSIGCDDETLGITSNMYEVEEGNIKIECEYSDSIQGFVLYFKTKSPGGGWVTFYNHGMVEDYPVSEIEVVDPTIYCENDSIKNPIISNGDEVILEKQNKLDIQSILIYGLGTISLIELAVIICLIINKKKKKN